MTPAERIAAIEAELAAATPPSSETETLAVRLAAVIQYLDESQPPVGEPGQPTLSTPSGSRAAFATGVAVGALAGEVAASLLRTFAPVPAEPSFVDSAEPSKHAGAASSNEPPVSGARSAPAREPPLGASGEAGTGDNQPQRGPA